MSEVIPDEPDTGIKRTIDGLIFSQRKSMRSWLFWRWNTSTSFRYVAPSPSLSLQASNKAILHWAWLLFPRSMLLIFAKVKLKLCPTVFQSVILTATSCLTSRGHFLSKSVVFNPCRNKTSSKVGRCWSREVAILLIMNVEPRPIHLTTPTHRHQLMIVRMLTKITETLVLDGIGAWEWVLMIIQAGQGNKHNNKNKKHRNF